MSWNNRILALLLVCLPGCSVHPAAAAEACPVRDRQPLRLVDIFDGPPEDLATLVPDEAGNRSGYWLLGYIYDAHRFVMIRCKYADKQIVDVKLSKRVDRCDYKIDAEKTLTLSCK